MSFNSNNTVLWEDLLSIYSTLNKGREKFSFPSTEIPSEKQIKAETPNEINALIKEMSSNKYLTNVATGLDEVIYSNQVIKPNFLKELDQQTKTILETCAFNSSFFTSNYSGFNSSFFSSNYSGFNSSFFSSNYSGFNSNDFSFNFRSSNFGFNSGFYSNNFSFNSSFNSNNYSGFNSSFNSSNFGFTANSTNVGGFSFRGSSFSSCGYTGSRNTSHNGTGSY